MRRQAKRESRSEFYRNGLRLHALAEAQRPRFKLSELARYSINCL